MMDKITQPRRRNQKEFGRPKNISMNSRLAKVPGLKSLKETFKSGTIEKNTRENQSSTFEISSNPNNIHYDENVSHNIYSSKEQGKFNQTHTLNSNQRRARKNRKTDHESGGRRSAREPVVLKKVQGNEFNATEKPSGM